LQHSEKPPLDLCRISAFAKETDPPPSSAADMHKTAIHARTEQKPKDSSARCAENSRRVAEMLQA
jgi:hypothetical protein